MAAVQFTPSQFDCNSSECLMNSIAAKSWGKLCQSCCCRRIAPNWVSVAAAAGWNDGIVERYVSSSASSSLATTSSIQRDPSLITVALLGPPNAGKSTLFNRLLDKRINKVYKLSSDKKVTKRRTGRLQGTATSTSTAGGAIVSQVPGTTRDRRECIGRIGGTYFRLLDTAGVDGDRLDVSVSMAALSSSSSTSVSLSTMQSHKRAAQELIADMMKQTLAAARQAELVFLMFDARVGVTTDLLETVRWLRKVSNSQGNKHDANHDTNDSNRKVVLLANKLEGMRWNDDDSPILDHLHEATRVGFGEPLPISAQHGEGMVDIAVIIEEMTSQKRQRLESSMMDSDNAIALVDHQHQEKPLQLAILGRQNVGKSTLVNAMLQEERVIVGSMAGLTRDAIAVEWTWQGRPVQIVDTAGIRKRSRREHGDEIEDMAVDDAMRAMKVADVAVLVIDADSRLLHRQELAIADAVLKEGRSLVVAANKMDLILEQGYDKSDFEKGVRDQLEARFPMLRKTPIVAMSSLTGECVQDLVPVVFRARERWEQTISTGRLNRWLADVLEAVPPPRVSGREARIKYVMQTKGRPPTFLLFCNTATLPDSYLRHLTRHFQDTFEMFGMEIRMAVKKSASSNPYEPASKRVGTGIGGREARKQRLIAQLKRTGAPASKRRRDRQR
ncbi:hypothetical protein MPSEU_000941400 [Mayamaea pseudoterrestris]|nr:hypothetical protein MPSEU_000941400 [Mayamaea pseudoterrestris]